MLKYPKTGVTQCVLGTEKMDVTGSQRVRRREHSNEAGQVDRLQLVQGFVEFVQDLGFYSKNSWGSYR